MTAQPPTWDHLRILLAVHRGKSFVAAAKALGVATSTVARQIETLEAELGRPLVHRGNGGTDVDAEALNLIALAEQMELGLEALRRDTPDDTVGGTVRISVIEGAVRPLVHMFARLRTQHPALCLEVASESRLVDLARREADIGIRIARAGTPTLVEKHAGQMTLAVFGAKAYVAEHLPHPHLPPAQAARHPWVALDRALEKLPSEAWLRAYGAQQFALRAASNVALEEGIVAGLGLGILSEFQAAALGLVRIQTESMPPPVDVFLAFHRDAKRTPRIRAVLTALEVELRRLMPPPTVAPR